MTLLRELIDIPEAVHKGDFVMSLAEGVTDAQATTSSYVVTDQLARAFDNALGFVASAVGENKSKAAYLDGSFGSGKSHFMAVLHLLLQRDPDARSITELADVIARHDPSLKDLSFELVPFHMIGAESMEQAVFGGYVEHLKRVDPQASTPGVFADAGLFEQADREREQLGEDKFFAQLNKGAGDADEGWGDLASPWTPSTYAEARNAELGDPRRGRLSGAVVDKLVPALRDTMSGSASGYVPFDVGLAELARHSQARGHSALVFFLDELILWLGSQIENTAFVAREGQKLIKLIEFTTPRPIPIISFVARQRDLREFVGDQVPGAEKLSFADALKHWNDRFHRVDLADRNLPKIAQRRLLEPRGEAERQEIDAAFQEIERERPEVLNVLLTDEGDRDEFRSTYPFSPAFMTTLVAASSVLQRERTALRVMLQLLVSRRNELHVGDLVGVGDLFDVLAEHDEPFSDDLKRSFDRAKDLHRDQFVPLLRAEHALAEGEIPPADHPFHADDRLVKTLLLAALVPHAEALRNLDVGKLTALNHGSLRSPLPGGERSIALRKLQKLAARGGGELKLGSDPQNPSVEVRLTGVDLDQIVDRAAAVDSPGTRKQMIKQLVLSELGVDADSRLQVEHETVWRGTRRRVEVVFGNVRDTDALPDDALRSAGDQWKVAIDYPFDPGHSPSDDLDRLDRWQADHDASQTVCWVPAFFSGQIQHDLARLVVVDHVLEGERLAQFADHLSAQDRSQAKGLLEDHRSALEQQLRTAIRQAYGVETASPEMVDPSHEVENRLRSLTPGFTPQVQVGNQLGDAFERLLKSMLDHQYPDHPRFEMEIKLGALRTVMAEVERAVEAKDDRIEVPSEHRKVMRRIATPLDLGVQHEVAFVLNDKWKTHLDRASAAATAGGAERVTVGDMRRSLEEPQPRGLTREVSALVILGYAAQTGKGFQSHGGPTDAKIETLNDDLELVAAVLPSEESWRDALPRASSVLGVTSVNQTRNPGAVEALAQRIESAIAEAAEPVEALPNLIEERIRGLGGNPEGSERLKTARAATNLSEAVRTAADPSEVVQRLASAAVPTSEPATGKSLKSAEAVGRALSDERWKVLDLVADRAESDKAFARIQTDLLDALQRDELAEPLDSVVGQAYSEAVGLLTPEPRPELVRPGSGSLDGSVEEAQAKLEELAGERRDVSIHLRWTFDEQNTEG